MLPCLPEEYQESSASDPGIEVFSYLTDLWRWRNMNGNFHFNLHPKDVNFEEVMEDIGGMINILRESDADIGEWFDDTKLYKLASAPRGSGGKVYAKIICQGL